MTSGILLPRMAERDVQRGRSISLQIRDQVREFKARGLDVLEVRVSVDTANYMRAFFAVAFRDFDNVLPAQVEGVPFFIGGTGGQDLEIKTRKRAH